MGRNGDASTDVDDDSEIVVDSRLLPVLSVLLSTVPLLLLILIAPVVVVDKVELLICSSCVVLVSVKDEGRVVVVSTGRVLVISVNNNRYWDVSNKLSDVQFRKVGERKILGRRG